MELFTSSINSLLLCTVHDECSLISNASFLNVCSELLLKDTLNKGHNTLNLSIKDKFNVPTGPWQYNLPLKEDNLCITVKL